jgi:hypothetical protein
MKIIFLSVTYILLNFKCDVKNKQNYYYHKQRSARYLVPGAKTENFRKIERGEKSSDLIDNFG